MGGGRRYFLPSTAQDPEQGSNAKHGRLDGRDLIKVYDIAGLGLWCLTPLSTYFSYIVAGFLLVGEIGVSRENR